ncbi:MAG TPA: hypothetical protein VKX28_06985 [Xanthobacteraceae bacterium]|nr:hypothetical protein [Xanthobacteraceae bacterium]
MLKPIQAYVGDDAIKRLLARYHCPMPFHAARMRLWGAIASPLPDCAPVAVLASLWHGNPPPFADTHAANAFFQDMMGFWNVLAGLQDGSPPLKLQKIDKLDSRDAMHAAAKLRVEELLDGFLKGFTYGQAELDVPEGVSARVHHVERAIETIIGWRNTFAEPPKAEDAAMCAEFARQLPVIDAAVEDDLNAIAVAVKAWRAPRPRPAPRKSKRSHGTLH